MTGEEYFMKQMFVQKIYKYTGQEFEDFFVQIMSASNPNFKPVKAFGKVGDKKNDGFDETTGTYYQVFSPEDLTKSRTISKGVEKLEEDFTKLYEYWNDKYPVKYFYYVVNDKYHGLPAPIYSKIADLSKNPKYETVTINAFLAKDLEKIFDNLSTQDKQNIIGFLPNINMDTINFSALHDVIEYLLGLKLVTNVDEKFIVPDFDKKIEINGLNLPIKSLLDAASYQEGELIQYFKEYRGLADNLKSVFNSLYEESKIEIPESVDNYPNKRFDYILEKCYPKKTSDVQHAILVLMAHYFSSCDIFEEPSEF